MEQYIIIILIGLLVAAYTARALWRLLAEPKGEGGCQGCTGCGLKPKREHTTNNIKDNV